MRLFHRLMTAPVMTGIHEKSFIMIKPCGIQRGLMGDIFKRFEQKGFKLVGLKFFVADKDLLREHYSHLTDKPFFPDLVNYMTSGPVLAMVWEGLHVVKTCRFMLGSTDPSKSLPGTIRGDYSVHQGRNIIHGSDSVESAERELKMWFKPGELVDWHPTGKGWVYENF